MPFREIDRPSFETLNQPDRSSALWSRDYEQTYFACDNQNVLGVLLLDSYKDRWSYMLCVPRHGGYRRIRLGADIPNEQVARRAIQGAMN